MTQWSVSSSNQEQYAYDASGTRILRRSTNGSTTTLTVYAFGLEDHLYTSSGTNQANTYYYSLAGHLIGALDGSGTPFYLTDALGSILTSFTNTASSAQVKGEQDYAPYGPSRYTQGSINTPKGYTGQYSDSLTGLDYYGSRFYDPVVGVFLSADKVEGDPQGMNLYGYVSGNPETASDPTGHYSGTTLPFSQVGSAIAYAVPGSGLVTTVTNTNYIGSITTASGQNIPTQSNLVINTFTDQQENQYGGYNPDTDPNNTPWAKLSREIGLDKLLGTFGNSNATWQDKVGAVAQFLGTNINNVIQLGLILGGPEDEEVVAAEEEEGSLVGELGGCSFISTTPVETVHGEQAIGTIKVGEQVWAYNPKTHKMELEPVQHVWINHDSDLVDLTLTSITPGGHGRAVTKTSETIHTNQKHPFLTEEKGFLPVGQITLGMHMLQRMGCMEW